MSGLRYGKALSIVLSILTLCLASCSSNYYKPEPPSLNLRLSTSPKYITDFIGHSTRELYWDCVTVLPRSTEGLINSLLCTQALLSREDVSADERQFALKRNRAALMRLLTLRMSGKEDKAHFHTHLNLDQPIIFASRMRATEETLQPNILGEFGVAIVVREAATTALAQTYYPQEGTYSSYTLMFQGIKLDGNEVHITLDAQQIHGRTTVRVGSNAYMARYSPSATYLALLNDATVGGLRWQGFVGTKQAKALRGIYVIGEMSDTKIPLIMIHGLNSSPLIWRYLTMAVMNDEWLNECYQVWHVLYPSGQPPLYSAMKIRRELDALLATIDNPLITREAVFIGHSLGGLVTKLLTVKSGNAFWDTTFTVPPEQLAMVMTDDIEDTLFFEPRFETNTVFYLDTPHKGSALAASALGYIGSSLVQIPYELKNMFVDVLEDSGLDIVQPQMQSYLAEAKFKSLDSLKPGHPLMNTLYTMPVQGKAYSIIGSKKQTECENREVCLLLTDGVVTYESADIPEALERLIVVSKHNSFKSPDAVSFILKHL
ncbi:alpha/beta hydrolase [Alteromonas sp. 1_MG-2023]|uniref:esterase/lipase family protein n=1 Tax=Alteromonas sp. 1_MG-2023 TaxID=3062669 RepID=UPI0026E3CD64|nr:alpha/beta hydrolase [Alteromonas sp. 1_MG-2023]MDO6565992.1 alpha/beta hydrolase [Alteromonas sp. 1_MG-2023]